MALEKELETLDSFWILRERSDTLRQLNPRVSAAVVYGDSWWWEVRVRKRSYGDTYAFALSFFRMEEIGTADRTEPENEPCTLVTCPHILSGGANDLERCGEARQCGEHTTGPLLAGEAVTDPDHLRFTFDLNP